MNSLHQDQATEARLPANAFRLNGDGTLREGIELQLAHPLVGRDAAVMIGTRYIKRDRNNGCIYSNLHTGIGIARRAAVKQITIPDSGKKVHTLMRPNREDNSLLLAVNTTVNQAKGVEQHVRFFSGVQFDGEIITQYDDEALLRFTAGEVATIFYSDGGAVWVKRRGEGLEVRAFSLTETGLIRLQQALGMVTACTEQKGRDFWVHQIIAVLVVGGNRSESLRNDAFRALMIVVEGHGLSKSTANAATDALQKWPALYMEFRIARDAGFPGSKPQPHTATVVNTTFVGTPAKKGPPAAVLARKRERSLRDQAIRSAMKSGGSNQSKPDSAGGKKSSKKK